MDFYGNIIKTMYRNISQYIEKISQYIAIHFSCIVTPLLASQASSEANSTSMCQKLVASGVWLVSFREDWVMNHRSDGRVLEIFFRVSVNPTDTGCKLVSPDRDLSVRIFSHLMQLFELQTDENQCWVC